MARWRAALAATGVALLLVSLLGAWLTWGPRPLDHLEVMLDGPGGPADWARLSFEWPRWMVVEGRSQAKLHLEIAADLASGEAQRLLTAELQAPGFQVEPTGEQVIPTAELADFRWTVRAEEPGLLEWRPEASLRPMMDEALETSDQLLWSKSVSVRVLAPAGMGSRALGWGSLLSATLAAAAGVGWRLAR